jgi:hypothetical protein
MQHRRDFFKSIAGLFAVAAVDPSLFLKSGPDAAARVVAPTILDQFTMLTHYMHRELVNQLAGCNFQEPDGERKMGTEFPYQYGIDLDLSLDSIDNLPDEAIRQRYVLPAMTRMANEIIAKKATRFARLQLPPDRDVQSCLVVRDAVALRGIRGYQMPFGYTHEETGEEIWCDGGWIHRFDVLFG